MSSPASSHMSEHASLTSSTNARRSFTLPARPALRSASTPASRNTSDGIETLFLCQTCKIVSFTAAGPARRLSPSPTSSKSRGSPARSIAWTSPTERTLAVGMVIWSNASPPETPANQPCVGALRIYRVTASNVSFLNSGNLLHTIFPRSQCWCVDGQSVFVLRIRQDSYYRIELPYETEDDKEAITLLKSVLNQVLQYERTQCPFTRDFEADVPERPKTPPRKQPRRHSTLKPKKWTFDKAWVPQSGHRPTTPNTEGSEAGTAFSYDDDDRSSVCTDSSEVVPEYVIPPKSGRRLSFAERVSMFQGAPPRPITAPALTERNISALSMERIPESPRAVEDQKPVLERHVSEADSTISSADSFYSVATSPYPSPSPPYLDAEPDLLNPWADNMSKQEEKRGRSIHRRQMSELTVRAASVELSDETAPLTPTIIFHQSTTSTHDVIPSSAPSTPPLVSDSDDDSVELPGLDITTPPDAIRMRRLTGASQRRAFSPMPQPRNLFIPSKPPVSRQFANALVRKTYELVIGPPAHLVSLMLRIAATISNFGFLYRLGREEKIPGSWESEDQADWPEEDDFGIPLGNIGDTAHRRRAFLGDLD
ncbi:inheritance of peroxisomes protein 1-domain-containing protein [Phaeosphaeriaceae sp. PMI808]|nr:inheritance of peroxisomes protein 1-domain-containing protein [Phaeosphaeriaceae sp. PMI808]